MEINDRKSLYEGMSLGRFAGEREKALKESGMNGEKVDSFTHSPPSENTRVMGKSQKLGKKLLEIFADSPAKKGKEPLPASSLSMEGYMIPANEGKITHMTLTYGMTGTARDGYIDAFKTFLSHMPDAKFTVLTSGEGGRKELQGLVKKWAREGAIGDPARVHIIDSGQSLSIWAQDSTLVVGNKVIEQDRAWFPGWGDGKVAGELAKANPELKYERMEGIFIDGGNQVATRDAIFVGSDAIAFMMRDMGTYPAKYQEISAEKRVPPPPTMDQEEWCKSFMDRTFPHQKVIIIGHKGQQPAFHIDMAMTPLGKPDPATGKPVILVGDPSMALRTLKDLKAKSPAKYESYQQMMGEKVGYGGSTPLDSLVETLGDDRDLQQNFDAIAKGLQKDGYKIERVPYLGSSSLRSTPWITYNNAVIDGDNVFVPNFAIPELDDPANKVYKKYGYNPVPMDMTAISSLQGAINCITKVAERQYA
ncbi:MAG: hypothetical protein RDV48_11535 [Candidatus Eremiobacteraeota bacterium]|nr:hypothetical protein [Candidatus Eremiobacteraeota bacterium]